MAELYATLIINGKRDFASIPDNQKNAVKGILLSLGLDENDIIDEQEERK